MRPGDRLVIGLSGGVDSVALLDCLQRCAKPLRLRLSALHVNHQISPAASSWVAFCRRLCRARGVPFHSVKVKVGRGGGIEAAARAARYAAFAAQECDAIVLAHHRDDQVETFLLQLLRGAGLKGLAAMPLVRKSEVQRLVYSRPLGAVTRRKSEGKSPSILRPMLDVTRAEIVEYAKARKLKWVEDDSNADVRFARNYLRHAVLPVLARRVPAYLTTIARSIGHVAEAAHLMDEVAAADSDGHVNGGALSVDALRRLSGARARNLLRAFLAGHGIAMPAAERLEEALRQALAAKHDAQVLIELEGSALRRYAGYLHVVREGRAPRGYSRRWRGERRLVLDAIGGVLTLTRATGAGISLARLRGGEVTVRPRRGGERLRPDCRRPRRTLKNLLQESGLPPWLRDRLPLMFCDGKLAWAAGIGVDCDFQAVKGEAGIVPGWVRHP